MGQDIGTRQNYKQLSWDREKRLAEVLAKLGQFFFNSISLLFVFQRKKLLILLQALLMYNKLFFSASYLHNENWMWFTSSIFNIKSQHTIVMTHNDVWSLQGQQLSTSIH